MDRKGITLIELTITMTLSGILMLSAALFFVSQTSFIKLIQDKITAEREARIVINHMSKIIRIANPGDDYVFSAGASEDYLRTKIKGGYIGTFPSDKYVKYELAKDGPAKGELSFYVSDTTSFGSPIYAISNSVSFFDAQRDPNTDNITLTIRVDVGGHEITTKTAIKAIGV